MAANSGRVPATTKNRIAVKVDSFHSPSGCVATLLVSNAVRLSSTWALREAGPHHSIHPNSSMHGPLTTLRSVHAGCTWLLRQVRQGWPLSRHAFTSSAVPGQSDYPASGIFATSGRERFGWLTSFQPEDSRHRVRRATFPRYVVKALRTS